jgi:hypothetical protein
MEPVEALHTAARRYALQRAAEWVRRYDELLDRERRARQEAGVPEPTSYSYSDEALATFPRYNVLRTIKWALEAISPSQMQSLAAARERLAEIGWSADSDYTESSHEISRRVIDEERALFADYVRSLSEEDLDAVEPLRAGAGGPISSAGDELSPKIWALICWQGADRDSRVGEWIFATLDTAGVTYKELIPGVCRIDVDDDVDFDALDELLEDAGMDADDRGEWPEGGILHIPPFRHLGRPREDW